VEGTVVALAEASRSFVLVVVYTAGQLSQVAAEALLEAGFLEAFGIEWGLFQEIADHTLEESSGLLVSLGGIVVEGSVGCILMMRPPHVLGTAGHSLGVADKTPLAGSRPVVSFGTAAAAEGPPGVSLNTLGHSVELAAVD